MRCFSAGVFVLMSLVCAVWDTDENMEDREHSLCSGIVTAGDTTVVQTEGALVVEATVRLNHSLIGNRGSVYCARRMSWIFSP